MSGDEGTAVPGRGRRRVVLAAAGLALVYAALLVAVALDSPLVRLDEAVLRWGPAAHWPALYPALSIWVLLGQRAVCLAVAGTWLAVRAVRTGDPRPLLTLGVATLALNASVGLVKSLLGREGPLELGSAALHTGASAVFDGGTIFPSGHTANAVVTWGLLALLAPRRRFVSAVVAALVAGTVGLTTIYLGTHWVSDVLAGWAAGGLVLLAVPALTPVVDMTQRVLARGSTGLRRWRSGRRRSGAAGAGWAPTKRMQA